MLQPFVFKSVKRNKMSYIEAVCQRQDYINEDCIEIKPLKEGNLQEAGKRDTFKEKENRKKEDNPKTWSRKDENTNRTGFREVSFLSVPPLF